MSLWIRDSDLTFMRKKKRRDARRWGEFVLKKLGVFTQAGRRQMS